MEYKPYTKEMIETIKKIIKKGGEYRYHADSGKLVVSMGSRFFLEDPDLDYVYTIWITDYDNYTKNWSSFTNPEERIDEYITAFYFEKRNSEDWAKHVDAMKVIK